MDVLIQEVKDHYKLEIEKRPITMLVKGWIAHVDRKTETNKKNINKNYEIAESQVQKIVARLVKLEHKDKELQAGLDQKVPRSEGDEIWAHFARFALYDDYYDLHNKTVPVVDMFQKQMNVFMTEHVQNKEMIYRFDDVITDKANKN